MVKHTGGRPASEMEAVEVAFRIGEAAAQAGIYKSKNAAELALRVKYGMEMGLGPATALQSVAVINGSPSLTAGAIASRIGGHPDYDYEVTEHTEGRCTIIVYRHKRGEWRECPPSTFTLDDAAKAGLLKAGPWKQYPRNMLYARALTNAARWHAAEVFGGSVYTPDELGADVDEQGEVVTTAYVPRTAAAEPLAKISTAVPALTPVTVNGHDYRADVSALKAAHPEADVKAAFVAAGVSKFSDLNDDTLAAITATLAGKDGDDADA